MHKAQMLWVAVAGVCLTVNAVAQEGFDRLSDSYGFGEREQGDAGIPRKGDYEIRLAGSLDIVSGSDYDITDLAGQFTINWFCADNFSLGASLLPNSSIMDYGWGEETLSRLFMLLRADLYLARFEDRLVPYIGGHAGLVSWEIDNFSDTTMTYGGHGGLIYRIGERTAFSLELMVSLYDEERYESENITVTSLLAGYSVYF